MVIRANRNYHSKPYLAIDVVSHKANHMARDITKKRHYSPSYYRYRQKHPTVSVVVNKEIMKFLDVQRKDKTMSYSQLVKQFIQQGYDLAQVRTTAHEEGYRKGMDEGERKFQKQRQQNRVITLGKCNCGKPIRFDLNNPVHVRTLFDIVHDSGVVHQGCLPKSRIIRSYGFELPR